jgi:hypothetical protein
MRAGVACFCSGCLVVTTALPGQTPAAPARIVVPAATPAAVAAQLDGWFGATATIETAAAFDDRLAAQAAVLLLWDEWTLTRAAAAGAEVVALPFADAVVVIAEAGVTAVGGGLGVWEAVAVQPRWHDRLGLVAPEVDGGPWLAAMQHRLARGDRDDAGLALWTTLDARAGRLADAYAAVVADLVAGRLGAAIGPRRVLAPCVTRADEPRRWELLPAGSARRGIAVTVAGGAPERAIARALAAPDRQQALAVAAALELAPAAAGTVSVAQAQRWWLRFEAQVRGQGRGVERLAEWLDLLFGIGFLACA